MKRIEFFFKTTFIITIALLSNVCSYAQTTINGIPSKPNGTRVGVVAGANAAVWVGTYLALNKAWYANYPKSKFHFFNDNKEWEHMDKLGHAWTAYQIARVSADMWRWTGVKNNSAVLIGGASALAFQSIIEIQDGFSSQWGFSWGDMAANTAGAGIFVAQELIWQRQRSQIKFGYFPYNYPPEFMQRRNDLFGSSPTERILKDYNSQTYWFSNNLNSYFGHNIPPCINVAVGYSSDLMLGATENKWTGKEGSAYDYTYIHRVKRFYISPDIDFTQIKTNSSFCNNMFFVLNAFKFFLAPSPFRVN